jgi:hypothetical protein
MFGAAKTTLGCFMKYLILIVLVAALYLFNPDGSNSAVLELLAGCP